MTIFNLLPSWTSEPFKYLGWLLPKGVKWKNARASPGCAYVPTTIEHVANIITHGIWIPPSIYAGTVLIHRSATRLQYFSAVVYGSALVLCFTVSTVFHSIFYCGHNHLTVDKVMMKWNSGTSQWPKPNGFRVINYGYGAKVKAEWPTSAVSWINWQLKDLLHRGDRAMIYVFIAASYFPWVMLRPLPQDSIAAELWWLVWVLAAAGILYQQIFHERYKTLETCFYIFLGSAPSLAVLAHIEHAEFSGIQELTLGGVLYAVGVCFFKSDGLVPFAHAIWHMFVGTAATVHYYAILHHLYSVPLPAPGD